MKNNRIGKYKSEGVIGQGSFGKVYMGVGENNQRVALKCIAKKNRTTREINNLKSETQLLTKIKHENVISMKECLETDTELIVVMEYAGADLSKILEKEKKLPQDKVRFYGKQILSAMLYLHQNRILHRDLKPQNILLHKDQIKICDFGFAKKMSASTNFLMSIKGTPLYIAPEILQNRPYTHKVDIWSFGIILYELAIGRTPFYAQSIQQLTPKILHESVKFPSSMSLTLRELIDGMLQKAQSKRFDWQQVKNHKFFNFEPNPPLVEIKVEPEVEEKPKAMIKWNAEEEIAEMIRLDSQFMSGKLAVKDLKYNEDFCLRVTQLVGECCIDRTKIPKEILVKTLKLVTKMAMSKPEPKENQQYDIAKNKTLMTAVITLGLEQCDEELLSSQLELIGFLLKQNFDGIKIDTDHDDQITALVIKQFSRPCSRASANLCYKVLGILASQAITTLSQSEQFFQRVAEEKLLSVLAERYSSAPEDAIILECLQKFIHPKLERNAPISHKTKNIFKSLREEVALVLLKKGIIGQQSPMARKWLKSNDLEIYCEILLECLSVSDKVRTQFLKKNYWSELLSNRKVKLYFIAFCYVILKESGVYILSNQIIQNEIVNDPLDNKLCHLYLMYFAYNTLITKHANSKIKPQKVKSLISSIKSLLFIDQDLKIKHSKELFGFFNNDSKYFDSVLIEILYNLLKDSKDEDLFNISRPLLEQSLMLPLSEHTFLQVLELLDNFECPISPHLLKRMDDYFLEMLKKQGFDDYLVVSADQSSRLLTKLLNYQSQKLADDKQVFIMADLMQKYHLLRLIFSEQVLTEDLLSVAIRIINKIIVKLKSLDFLASGALQMVKKYYKTTSEDLRVQIMTFCSHLARMKSEYCSNILETGIVAICFRYLGENSELVKQKVLHLIGNLSKHNSEAFDQFEKSNIVAWIYKCICTHRSNKKILKNTIYAIGNISYYSERFASDIKPLIRILPDGLAPDDEHLLLNTISTISNLLRHSSVHLPALIESGTLSRVMEIFTRTSNADQANYCSNLLRKAVAFPDFIKTFPKDGVKSALENNVKKGLLKQDNDAVKKLRQLLC